MTQPRTPNLERLKWWADDLASGKYKQAQGALASSVDGVSYLREPSYGAYFCCLGVAIMTAQAHGFDEPVDWDTGVLPGNVAAWYGLDSLNPALTSDTCTLEDCDAPECGYEVSATELNDSRGVPFADIAGMIYTKYGIPVAD